MIKDKLHSNFCQKDKQLVDWYCQHKRELQIPIYSSYDVRDAGFKVSNVDANIYPAGFNNICPVDKENTPAILDEYLKTYYQQKLERILLLTEEHTNNPYYWDNVHAIQTLIEQTGRQVLVGLPREMTEPLQIQSTSGHVLTAVSGFGNSRWVKEFNPGLVISNNDFSNEHLAWAESIPYAINPPRELGWYQRKKSTYFQYYNQLATEFADICGIDPFVLTVQTELFSGFDLADDDSIHKLASRVDNMIAELKNKYNERGIQEQPFVFVKNNAGTYGLAVIRVGSGAEVLEWNYKSRKKMKAAKGGREVQEVIIQEGISTRVVMDGVTAEPVIYMIGDKLAGGFLRTHAEKNSSESLNSPGAVYKRLCVSDLEVSLEGSPLENVYGWSARIGALAIGLEAKSMGISFKGYTKKCC